MRLLFPWQHIWLHENCCGCGCHGNTLHYIILVLRASLCCGFAYTALDDKMALPTVQHHLRFYFFGFVFLFFIVYYILFLICIFYYLEVSFIMCIFYCIFITWQKYQKKNILVHLYLSFNWVLNWIKLSPDTQTHKQRPALVTWVALAWNKSWDLLSLCQHCLDLYGFPFWTEIMFRRLIPWCTCIIALLRC